MISDEQFEIHFNELRDGVLAAIQPYINEKMDKISADDITYIVFSVLMGISIESSVKLGVEYAKMLYIFNHQYKTAFEAGMNVENENK